MDMAEEVTEMSRTSRSSRSPRPSATPGRRDSIRPTTMPQRHSPPMRAARAAAQAAQQFQRSFGDGWARALEAFGGGPGVPATSALGATTDLQTGAPGLASPLAGVPQAASDLTTLQPFETPEAYKAATGGGRFQKGVDNTDNAIVDFAKQFVGTPYVWGGTSYTGVDCSGLIQLLYKDKAGISLPRTSSAQGSVGTKIPRSQAQPGGQE